MSDLGLDQLLTAGAYGLLALVWSAILEDDLRLWRRWRSPQLALAASLDATTTVFLGLLGGIRLLPRETFAHVPGWLVLLFILSDWLLLAIATQAHHIVRYFGIRGDPPSRRWLLANYGSGALLGVLTGIFPSLLPGATFDDQLTLYLTIRNVFIAVVFGLTLLRVSRGARRGAMRPGAAALVPRYLDVLLMGISVVALGCLTWAVARGKLRFGQPGGFSFDLLITIPVTLPWMVRKAGRVLRVVLLGAGTIALTAGALVWIRAVTAPLAAAGAGRLAGVLTVLTLVLIVVPGRALLRTIVDRVVYRRQRRFWEARHAFLGTLSPEAGVAECCRRALAELQRALGLRGIAALLCDGTAVAVGDFDLEPLRRVWPVGDAFGAFMAPLRFGLMLHDLPLPIAEALIAVDVAGCTAITSPRQRWGHAFGRGGAITGSLTDEDERALSAFFDQLALVLDTADLLARAVGVERSLAQAEKLAAIGETAARIAHEIRNPVTAARSLAQQLSREPGSPFQAEHALIVTELERIERQVSTLLRFARREEYQFTAVDLGELVRGTAAQFAPRCAAADIALELEAPEGVVVRGDREKLRQVLINLLDNGIDALADVPEGRRLRVAVQGVNGTASIRVEDTGPGVTAEALPHLFEPFWSGKAMGTGLGLAIAQRTMDAHSGRIDADAPAGGGMTFRVTLPVARDA
jgi:signal transduction histidine kinase